MSASKSDVKNYLTINNVEHSTSSSTFTDESVHSTDRDINYDTFSNEEEIHQNSLSNYGVDESTEQFLNSEHIQHNVYAQSPYEQDTTIENLLSPTSLSSDSTTHSDNHSLESTLLIDTQEYPVHPVVDVENLSSYEASAEKSVTIEQVKQLLQRLASESTAYTYDVPHIVTIIKDPYVYEDHNDSNIASNEYIIDMDSTFNTKNDHVLMSHIETPDLSSTTNDELNASQLLTDENGEYLEIPAREIILVDEYYPNTNDIYQ